jgi:hypothetical protein
MDQPYLAAAPAPALPRRAPPVLSDEHRAVINRIGVRALMTSLCLYAMEMHEAAEDDGCTGSGWYDLGSAIDEITPANEADLWGGAAESDAPCRGCRTGGERCTC